MSSRIHSIRSTRSGGLGGLRWRRLAGIVLLLAFTAPASAVAGFYDLVFVSPVPIEVPENAGTMNIQIDLQQDVGVFCPEGSPVDWSVNLLPVDTLPGDFGPPMPATLTFTGTMESAFFTIPINDNGVFDGDRTFDIILDPIGDPTMFCKQGDQPPSMGQFVWTATIIEDEVPPPPELTIDDAIISEDQPSVTVMVHINPMPQDLVTVDYTTVDGDAMSGEDYAFQSGQVTFMPGETAQPITISLMDDFVFEGVELFFIQLTGVPTANAVILDDTGEIQIQDDELPPPPPEISIDDTTVGEDDGTAVLNVHIDPPPQDLVTVDYITMDDGAVAGEDYVFKSGQVTFMPGESDQPIPITILDDSAPEDDEKLVVKLTGVPTGNADIIDDMGEVLILDNDEVVPPPSLTIDDVNVVEGDDGTVDAVFTVVLDNTDGNTVTVDFETLDLSATADDGDYQPQSGTLTFTPPPTPPGFTPKQPLGSRGGLEVQTITVPVVGDTRVEGNEEFEVKLFNAGGAVIEDDRGVGLIVDDDDPAEPPDLVIDDVTLEEGDEGTTAAFFEVRLTEPSDQVVRVDFATADGSATAGEDYQEKTQLLTFAPGVRVINVGVAVIGDIVDEEDETFFARLSNPINAEIADGEGVGLILDEDETVPPPPDAPSFSIDDVTIAEGDADMTAAVFTVSLSAIGERETTAMVSFATSSGSATAGADFGPAEGRLSFPPGTDSQTVTVLIRGDTMVEDDEDFFVDLDDPENAEIEDGRGRGLIIDDDVARPTPTLSIGDAETLEGDAGLRALSFPVTLSEASNNNIEVSFQTLDGTATGADNDYQPRNGTVGLAPGQTEATIQIPVVGDTTLEADELFTVDLFDPIGATIADGTARGTILNDDAEAAADLIRLLRRTPVLEGAGAAEIVVERVGNGEGPAGVILTTVEDSARAGSDFEPLRRMLRWNAGETGQRLIEVPIVDDRQREDDEAFFARLLNATGATLGQGRRIPIVIVDDDDDELPIRLVAVGDQELTGQAGEDIRLAVEVRRGEDAPVEGATIRWLAEGAAEVLGGEEVVSDEAGRAGKNIRLARRPGPATVVARLVGSDSAIAFRVTVEGNLADDDPNADTGQAGDGDGLGEVLDESCSEAGGELGDGCDFLFGLSSGSEREQALQALTPRGVITQGNTALRGARVQFGNIIGRLEALRAGTRQSAIARLGIDIQGDPLALGQVRNAFASSSADPEARLAEAIDEALYGHRYGGRVDAADESGSGQAASPGGESRWGFFVNGRASFGDSPRTARESGYDFESQGLTAGIDYRLSSTWVIGAGLGYQSSDVDVDRNGGRLDVSGYSLSLYWTHFRGAFYVDGVLGYGENDYELARVIDLPRPFQGTNRLIARGEPGGDQLSLSVGAGYDGRLGALSLGGFLRGHYVDADIDAYREVGAGPFNLALRAQQIESLQSEAGVELAYPWSRGWGVLQPLVRLSYLHEFEDDSRLIRAVFAVDPAGRPFAVRTDVPDRDYFNLGAGLTATLPRGIAAYLQYDTDLERDDLDIYTLSGGVRIQLGKR